MRRARGILTLSLALLCATALAAQSGTPSQSQFWPELDYYQRLSDHSRLFATAQWSLSGLPGQQDEQYGLAFDLFLARRPIVNNLLGAAALSQDRSEWTQLRLGYKYSQPTGTDSGQITNRLFAEATFRGEMLGLAAADRNGFDWRWIDGVYSNRYRNRVDLQRPVTISGYEITPYSNCEWAYVLGRSGWNSVKCEFGAQLPVLRHFSVIPYFGILNVWQVNPIDTQAFGLTVVASY
jgi:hypothetical protein